MAVGDIITASVVRSKYQTTLASYASFVWHSTNYPSYFPTAYLGVVATSSPQTTILSPNSSEIANAVTSLTDLVKAAAKSFTAIVTCRYRLYYNTNGSLGLQFDQTQKALFNSTYLVNLTSSSPVSGDINYDSTFNSFFSSIASQVATAQARYYDLSSTYCHSSCHSSCHGSRSRR